MGENPTCGASGLPPYALARRAAMLVRGIAEPQRAGKVVMSRNQLARGLPERGYPRCYDPSVVPFSSDGVKN